MITISDSIVQTPFTAPDYSVFPTAQKPKGEADFQYSERRTPAHAGQTLNPTTTYSVVGLFTTALSIVPLNTEPVIHCQ